MEEEHRFTGLYRKKLTLEEIKQLLDEGANPNANTYQTPLIDMVMINDYDKAELLLSRGADQTINYVKEGKKDLYIAIEFAIGNLNPRMVKLLLDYGADLEEQMYEQILKRLIEAYFNRTIVYIGSGRFLQDLNESERDRLMEIILIILNGTYLPMIIPNLDSSYRDIPKSRPFVLDALSIIFSSFDRYEYIYKTDVVDYWYVDESFEENLSYSINREITRESSNDDENVFALRLGAIFEHIARLFNPKFKRASLESITSDIIMFNDGDVSILPNAFQHYNVLIRDIPSP